MGMFDFLKKGNKIEADTEVKLFSPANGTVISIEEVADPVFSQKMMGDGYAVIPTDGKIYSPVTGKVVSVFPTKHAIGIELPNGVEVLLHMGLDTVELNGGPFTNAVAEGDQLTPETLVSTVDLAALEAAGKNNAMVVVFTNMDKVADFSLSGKGQASVSSEIGTLTAKS
ncbi:PTS system IIA component, Glc family [Carnobacterium alterfunditum]|uniref:PTS system IIA component, Glc family n=2 Tax=Carnobacterium alterfunditum TaxID=28230 RepID=A0A1N6HTE5_9LACT|nr:PTS system IIA component, Glc family [Carnobacterium alterfunditum]